MWCVKNLYIYLINQIQIGRKRINVSYMVLHENEDAVTYTVVVTPAQDSIPAATLQIKMRKFKAEVRVTTYNGAVIFGSLKNKRTFSRRRWENIKTLSSRLFFIVQSSRSRSSLKSSGIESNPTSV